MNDRLRQAAQEGEPLIIVPVGAAILAALAAFAIVSLILLARYG